MLHYWNMLGDMLWLTVCVLGVFTMGPLLIMVAGLFVSWLFTEGS
jgi:hypothetical protein